AEGEGVSGWRGVRVGAPRLGGLPRRSMPVLRQVYVARRRVVPSAFERKLFVIRKLVENRIRAEGLDPERRFHVPSLSSETIVYKGPMLPPQLAHLFPGLQAHENETHPPPGPP